MKQMQEMCTSTRNCDRERRVDHARTLRWYFERFWETPGVFLSEDEGFLDFRSKSCFLVRCRFNVLWISIGNCEGKIIEHDVLTIGLVKVDRRTK